MNTFVGSGVAPFSFTIKQGADLTLSCLWKDDNGNPMNLTGYQMFLPIRASIGSPDTLLTLSSAQSSGSYIWLGGTAGTFDLIFANADTSVLSASGIPMPQPGAPGGFKVFELGVTNLKYIDPTGKANFLFEGPVFFDPEA